MLIPLTSVQGKWVFGLAIQNIWLVERDAQNPLSTKVVTNISNGKSLIGYEVWETPEEVIALVAQAAGQPVPKLDYSTEPAAIASKLETAS